MKKSRFAIITITIITAILIPVLLYTIFQITEKNRQEELIKNIYDRQLNTILFSVNEHCWVVFDYWKSRLSTIVDLYSEKIDQSKEQLLNELDQTINKQNSIIYIFLKISQDQFLTVAKKGEEELININQDRYKINRIFEKNKEQIDTNIKHAKWGYIKPVIIPWPYLKSKNLTLLILPIRKNQNEEFIFAGLFVDEQVFVDDIIARKFQQISDEDLILAVRNREKESILYTTGLGEESGFELKNQLWLLPQLDLLIKLKGTTLENITKARTKTNLIFLILVNLVLILGIVIILRNLSKEMGLIKMKTDFVANVSHELRTPLALIRMYSETLEMNRIKNENKKQKYYKIIMNESNRLTQLINNILDFSKIESKRKEYRLKYENFSEIVLEILEMYSYQIEQNKILLEKNIEQNLPDIAIDRESVTQAIFNLLDNAIKFSNDNKRIHISLSKNRNTIIFSVKDTGIGIHESEQNKIFDKFYQASNNPIHLTKGSGLGLSLVKHIMDIHKGKIIVNSKIGEGSTFSLIFPIT